ncbi:MFS transporter [Streptomyces sp. XM4193]|uniref:MFS transporter n=1 Tax=Streptomyces sp. XM4193 TaxID=2929782 RepID=UPI001FF7B44B|nr:MFS transporter [Streptomyces sp. XM4193]MCK1798434.1 MFS transporter [Streptomyces sp. XM4193]
MPFTATRRRRAMFVLFMIPGLAMSTWVTRTPDIRDMVGASTAQMGLILLGLSVGSMTGVLSSGTLVSRWGTRPVTLTGMTLVALSLPVIAVGAHLGTGAAVSFGMMLFGLGVGGGEVSLNVEGAEVEQALGRSALPAMHGMFSVATTLGAVIGILCNAVGVPVLLHLPAMTALAAACLVYAMRFVPPGVGRVDRADTGTGSAGPLGLLRDRTLLLIGVVILAMAFAEGSANDWLPLIVVDGHGLSATAGSIAYAAFAAAMAVGRFGAGYFLARHSRATVVRASALSGAVGLALVIFAEHPALVMASVLLWGLGASVGFPVAISAAGESGPDSTARVSLAATIGYVAFLVGPPALGFLGDHYGLRTAMILVLALMGVAFATARAVGTSRGSEAKAPVATNV